MSCLAYIVPILLYIAIQTFLPMSRNIVKIPHRGYILAFTYVQSYISSVLSNGFKIQEWHSMPDRQNALNTLKSALYETCTGFRKSCNLQSGTIFESSTSLA